MPHKCRVCDGTGWAVDPATGEARPCVCPARFGRTEAGKERAIEVAMLDGRDSRRPRSAE